MAHNAGKHDIYIIEVAGEFRVRPPVAMVEGSKAAVGGRRAIDKELSIRNTTDYPAIVAFPSTFTQGDDVITLSNSASPATANKSVKLTPGLSGNYPYAVLIKKNGDLIPAIGESAPSVIVDP